MARKSLKVNKSLVIIGQYLEEARIKRCISLQYLSKYLKISETTLASLETNNSANSILDFLSYICYLKFDDIIVDQLKKYYKVIFFELYNCRIVKSLSTVGKFFNKLIDYLIIIKNYQKLNNAVVADRSGLSQDLIFEIENCQNVSLIDFLSYCNAIGVLDVIVNSLSFRYDEFGNMLAVKKLKEIL